MDLKQARKSRIAELEETILKLNSKLNLMEDEIVRLKAQSKTVDATKNEAVKTKDPYGFEEMTPDEYFGGAKTPSFTYGEIPVDGRGRIADPSWRYNAELDIYEQVVRGMVVKQVKKTGNNGEIVFNKLK